MGGWAGVCGCADRRYIESSQIHVRSLFLSSQPSLDLESESPLSLQGFPYVSHPSNHLRHSFAYVRVRAPKELPLFERFYVEQRFQLSFYGVHCL